jgi:hypothetical protein
VRKATGAYRLDASSAEFFRAIRLRLVCRGRVVHGRYGRTASVNGVLNGSILQGVWHDDERQGWLRVLFTEGFRSFEGRYGVGETSQPISGALDSRVSERDTKTGR